MAVTLASGPAGGAAQGAIEDTEHVAISDNGLFVAFTSTAPAANFGLTGVTDDASSRDVFLKNVVTGAVTLVSGSGNTARGGQYPDISADGRYVAFSSDYGGFASGGVTDTNGSNDIYILDAVAGTFAPVSVNAAGTGMGGNSIQPSVSDNGRVVAFVSTSLADQLLSGVTDANGTARDVFVRNLDTNATALVSSSTASATTTGNARAEEPAINADGTVVAFMSEATDLSAVSDATAGTDDIFRRVVAGTTTDLISVGTVSGSPGAVGGSAPSINGDGNLVAFASSSSAIVLDDTNSSTDVFVRNVQQGTTERVSTTAGGAQGQGNSINPSISEDGNFVAFQTSAANLVAPGTNAAGSDILIKNRTDGSLVRASQTDAGEPAANSAGGANSSFPEVNANGTAVAFFSLGTNLVAGAEDAAENDADLFVWTGGTPGPGDNAIPTAAITAPAVTAAGGTTHTLTVNYSDDVAVNASTIGADDITVTGPGGPLTVTAGTPSTTINGTPITGTYTMTPPGGTWDTADNGTYTVTVVANAVQDTAAKGVAATSGTFTVNIGGPSGPGPDLIGAIVTPPPLPPAVVGGQKGRMRVQVTNQGDQPVLTTRTAPLTIQIFASTDAILDAGTDTPVVSRAVPMRLLPGRSRFVPIPFVYPNATDGDYFLLANVDSGNIVAEGNETNNLAVSPAAVRIAAPFVDLVPTTVGAPTRSVLPVGRRVSVPVTVTNNGNVAASGQLQVDLFASSDATADAADLPLATITRPVRIKNGRSRPVRVNFLVPANLPAGTYFITTTIDQPNTIQESNDTNNTAVSAASYPAS